MKKIIDSRLELYQALGDNPDNPAPEEIKHSLGLMEVDHIGFDSQLHTGQIVVAISVMSDVEAFFEHAYELQFPVEKVIPAADPAYRWDDEKMMADNVSSGFNYRTIARTDQVSKHGQGLAFDINPQQNPYIRYEKGKKIVQPPRAVWNKERPGTLHTGHPLVRMMEGLGWEWGGHWTRESGRIDYQHFEKAS